MSSVFKLTDRVLHTSNLLLGAIQATTQIFPKGVIAGGFVRDIYLGRMPRDLDILVAEEPTQDQLLAIGAYADAEPKLMFDLNHEYDGDDPRDAHLYGVWKAGDIDIIFVSSIWQRIKSFPDHVSKCWVGATTIGALPEFYDAHEKKELWYRASAGVTRYNRLIEKFPDYRQMPEGDFPEEPENV